MHLAILLIFCIVNSSQLGQGSIFVNRIHFCLEQPVFSLYDNLLDWRRSKLSLVTHMICITPIMLIKLLGVASLVLISADALLHKWQYNFFAM